MFHWFRRRHLHLYAGYVSARRVVGQEPETLMAPLVVVASRKLVALEQGDAWLRGHCPKAHGWYAQHVELMALPDSLLPRTLPFWVFNGTMFEGPVRVMEDLPVMSHGE